MRRDVRAVRSLFASSEGPKVVARTRPQMRAKKKERRGRREERAKASRTQRSSSSRRLSLERSNPKRSLSSASSSSRKHSSRLRDVVAARAVLSVLLLSYIHHRTVFLLQNREQQHRKAKEQRCQVQSSVLVERNTHTQSGFKMQFQNISFSLSCWSYLPHPPSPRDRGRRE